jgi:D-alanyl-D-alanine carboxypeptidase/D-alanyl-D-alanine-endopeptidase (penicillin-binding protein 4)
MKLITTSAALELLGPNFRWETKLILTEDPKENYTDNIIIKGSGDPFFLIKDLRNLLRTLKVLGIKNISGDFILDKSIFNLKKFDREKFDGNPFEPYNVGPDALLLNFFSSEVVFSSLLSSTIKLNIFPPAKKNIKIKLQPTNKACKYSKINPKKSSKNIVFLGYIGKCSYLKKNFALYEAKDYWISSLFFLLNELDIKFSGNIIYDKSLMNSELTFAHKSRPLSDIIKLINKYSNNVMAENLFHTLTLNTKNKNNKTINPEDLISRFLKNNTQSHDFFIENGSGLSRKTKLTSNLIVNLLNAQYKKVTFPEFFASLPIAGLDGTLSEEEAFLSKNKTYRFKTGSLNNVRAMAGVIIERNKKPFFLCYIINHKKAEKAKNIINTFISGNL